MSRSCSILGSVATSFDSLNEAVGVAVLVVSCCFVCQALASESWRGGFYCRYPVRWVFWLVCEALPLP